MLIQISKNRSKKIHQGFINNLIEFNTSINSNNFNLPKLNKDNLLCVVTGQQVGLFLNPALALYKAIAAVKYSQYVEEVTSQPCIPIFWLQTEDHDFEEIKSSYFLSKENKRIKLELSSTNNKTPIALLRLEKEVDTLINELEALLTGYQFKDEALVILKSAYRPQVEYGQAFAKALEQLVPGIIFIDPVKCEVSKYCKNEYQIALDKFNELANALKESNSNQVALRDDATLFFYRENLERERLIKVSADSFKNSNKSFSVNELKESLASNPEKFSASALLRPLIQDCLLPTVAYIGGSAEISYLKQSERLYPLFNQSPPLFLKRPGFTIIDQKSSKWLSESKLEIKDLNLKSDELIKLIAKKTLTPTAQPEHLLNIALREINEIFDKVEGAISLADPTLLTPAKKARDKSLESLKLLLDKYAKAAAQKDQIFSDRINKIKSLCYPDEIQQERALSAIFLYAKFGPALIDQLFKSVDPLNLSQEMEIIL